MVLNGGPISWKASVVRQTLDKDAKELGKSKETLQKVRNSLDQLRVALLLKDPVFLVDGSGKVLPCAWISAQHHQVRACLVVGDVEKTSARINALDAEIDAQIPARVPRERECGGRRRAHRVCRAGDNCCLHEEEARRGIRTGGRRAQEATQSLSAPAHQ